MPITISNNNTILIVIIAGIFIGIGYLCNPCINSILTVKLNKTEQGNGFGVLYAIKRITIIITPFTFGITITLIYQKNI